MIRKHEFGSTKRCSEREPAVWLRVKCKRQVRLSAVADLCVGRQRMRNYTSHGQTIDVEFRSFGVFLWLVAGFVVRVQTRRREAFHFVREDAEHRFRFSYHMTPTNQITGASELLPCGCPCYAGLSRTRCG